jgi:hypothetical protein
MVLKERPFCSVMLIVKEGTAWFQTGKNKRLQAYWHHSKTFQPRQTPTCLLGNVVPGGNGRTLSLASE